VKRFAVLGLMVALAVWMARGQMAQPLEVFYAALSGQGVRGTAVVLALPEGGLEVFVYLEGLKPSSGAYANHIHYNRAGKATCKEQNGDQILGLTSLVPDANGRAVAYTRLPGARLPEGTTYVNVHANTPTPVGASIACGDLSKVKEAGYRY
jgi:Cu-Zn family superoxide dismutase